MRKPLVPVAVAFIMGILLNEWGDVGNPWLWIASFAALAVASLSLLLPARDWARAASVLLLVALVSSVLAHFRTRIFPPDHLRYLVHPERTIARIRCRIADHPLLRRDEPLSDWFSEGKTPALLRTSCTVEVSDVFSRGGPIRCRGCARLVIYEPVRDLFYGDELLVTGMLGAPPTRRNPGQFDYRENLAREGIYALMIAPVRGNVEVLRRGGGSFFWRMVYDVKGRMEDFIFRYIPEPQASVLSCVLLGNRASVPKEIEDAFQRTGTVHILSVSGLHMALLAGSLWYLLQWLSVRRKIAALLVLVFVCDYAAMTGATAPPLRAGVMAAVMCLGVILDRQPNLMNSLGLAALVILLADPNEVFKVGFQLSFLCVMGIGTFFKSIVEMAPDFESPLDRLESDWRRFAWRTVKTIVCSCVAVTASAQIVTAPLVARCFHLVNPLAILHNVHVIPTAWFALVIGMLLATLGALAPIGGAIIAFPLDIAARLFVGQITLTSWLPLSAQYVAGPSVAWMTAYFLVLGAVVWRRQLGLSGGRVAILGLCLAVVPVYGWLFTPAPSDLKVTCFDVGHGNSVLVQLPGGRRVLYDCGTMGNYDVGANIVAPFLWEQGVTRLDAVVLSHPHYDHVSGFPGLSERIKVGTLVVGPGFSEAELGKAMVSIARRDGVPVLEAAAGDVLTPAGVAAALKVLHPPPQAAVVAQLDLNDRSVVLQVDVAGPPFDRAQGRPSTGSGRRVLLMGDAGEIAFRMMLRRREAPRADVVQVPHHGMQAGVAGLLADALRPRMALITSKTEEEARPGWQALRDRGVRVLETARSGAIEITPTDGRLDVQYLVSQEGATDRPGSLD